MKCFTCPRKLVPGRLAILREPRRVGEIEVPVDYMVCEECFGRSSPLQSLIRRKKGVKRLKNMTENENHNAEFACLLEDLVAALIDRDFAPARLAPARQKTLRPVARMKVDLREDELLVRVGRREGRRPTVVAFFADGKPVQQILTDIQPENCDRAYAVETKVTPKKVRARV